MWVIGVTLDVLLLWKIISNRYGECIFRRNFWGSQLFGAFTRDFEQCCRTKRVLSEKLFKNALNPWNAIAVKADAAFTGSFPVNQFLLQNFAVRWTRGRWKDHLFVEFDSAVFCRVFLYDKQHLNFSDDMLSNFTAKRKDTFCLCFIRFQCRMILKFVFPHNKLEKLWVWSEKLIFCRTIYWFHCIGRIIIFGCSWQVWRCWVKDLKEIVIVFQKNQLYPSIH